MIGLRAAAAAVALAALSPVADRLSHPLTVPGRGGEVIAVIRAGCQSCDWSAPGREAAVVKISVDGSYSQTLTLVRGEAPADYPISLGFLPAGSHRIEIERDRGLSASTAGPAILDVIRTEILEPDSDNEQARVAYLAQSMAPILYARANTVGRFTDLPLLMWYEVVPTPRARQFRYSVVFSNEDGGTPTDRLMATWGRTTDIEFVYGAEIDDAGRVVAEEFQGPGHETPRFRGRHEGRHPLLWVSTDNNMVSEAGETTIRYAPAPEKLNLHDVSREVVMDRHPWTYAVTAGEMLREHKTDETATAGSGRIPDLRRFVYVEACSELETAALAFSVRTSVGGHERWFDADGGHSDFRIVRTGCFRGAVALPASAAPPSAVRFRAYARPPAGSTAAAPASVVLTRVNSVFTLDHGFLPTPSLFSWNGSLTLPIDGDWRELSFDEHR